MDDEELGLDCGRVDDEKPERQSVSGQLVRRNQGLKGAPCHAQGHDLYRGITQDQQTLQGFQPPVDESGSSATYRIAALMYDPLVSRNIRRELPNIQFPLRSWILNAIDSSLLGSVRDHFDSRGVNNLETWEREELPPLARAYQR
nr:hypothetical protein B0A51_00914 [Rachicladosporium sp. CCFEE 5018]